MTKIADFQKTVQLHTGPYGWELSKLIVTKKMPNFKQLESSIWLRSKDNCRPKEHHSTAMTVCYKSHNNDNSKNKYNHRGAPACLKAKDTDKD